MANPLYHIHPREPLASSAHATLFVQLDTNGVFLLVVDNRKLFELKYFRLEQENTEEYLSDLDNAISENFAAGFSFAKTVIICNWPDSSLVPDKLYSPESNREIIELIHGDLQKGTILSEVVNGYQMHHVYRLPSQVHEFITRRFPSAAVWHFNTLWLQRNEAEIMRSDALVQILIYPGYFLALACRSSKILLLQRFVYESDDDVYFYVISLFENLGLDKTRTDLLVSGFVFEDSALLTTLRQIFPRLSLSGVQQNETEERQPNQYPEHFFSPLLNIGTCAL